ncbi:MAG: hypothetical protein NTV22_13290 [bacterium]|nr:hypothetical protein [bacterium]
MKRFAMCFACLATCALLCASAAAATLQWSKELGLNANCLQTIADGNGGCAIVNVVAGTFKVTWFDKKGAERYSKSGLANIPILLACEKNALVFCYMSSAMSLYQVANVDAKGNETTISAAGVHYLSYVGVTSNVKVMRLSDRKGYFVEKLTPAGTASLERYSYK